MLEFCVLMGTGSIYCCFGCRDHPVYLFVSHTRPVYVLLFVCVGGCCVGIGVGWWVGGFFVLWLLSLCCWFVVFGFCVFCCFFFFFFFKVTATPERYTLFPHDALLLL